MIHDALITADELAQVTGYDQDAALKRALTQAGIVWFPGKNGRPWTTITLINAAGGLKLSGNDEGLYEGNIL